MLYLLAKHPTWQTRLRAEVSGLADQPMNHDRLAEMVETDWVIKETMRLYPPLSTLPKVRNTAFEYGGYQLPADALVITFPIHTHYMAEFIVSSVRS